MDNRCPIVVLVDILEQARDWKPAYKMIVHTARGKFYDARRISGKRQYLQCLICIKEIMRAGQRTFRHPLREHHISFKPQHIQHAMIWSDRFLLLSHTERGNARMRSLVKQFVSLPFQIIQQGLKPEGFLLRKSAPSTVVSVRSRPCQVGQNCRVVSRFAQLQVLSVG